MRLSSLTLSLSVRYVYNSHKDKITKEKNIKKCMEKISYEKKIEKVL